VAEATVCVNEETRITLCSIRATKGNPPFSCSVGERKIMNHFVVNMLFKGRGEVAIYLKKQFACQVILPRIISGFGGVP